MSANIEIMDTSNIVDVKKDLTGRARRRMSKNRVSTLARGFSVFQLIGIIIILQPKKRNFIPVDPALY